MVVKQPKFTRVEEPTLLCNQVGRFLQGRPQKSATRHHGICDSSWLRRRRNESRHARTRHLGRGLASARFRFLYQPGISPTARRPKHQAGHLARDRERRQEVNSNAPARNYFFRTAREREYFFRTPFRGIFSMEAVSFLG